MSSIRKAPQAKGKSSDESALTVARRALSIAKSLRSDSEVKFFDKSNSTTDFSTGVLYSLSNIAGGNTDVTRVGDTIRGKTLEVRMRVYDLVNSNTTFRVALFRQKLYTAFAYGNVFDADTTLALYNQDQISRWVFLKDMTIVQNSNFNLQDRSSTIVFTVNLNDLEIEWTGAGAGDYEKNHLWLSVTADYVSAAGPSVRPVAGEAGCLVNTRLMYTDA